MSGTTIALLALALSFDGGSEPSPTRSENVETVKGLSGSAVHLGKDSILEYSTDLPGFMTPTAGTFMAWFRHDRTMPSCHMWRDRDKEDNGDVSWFIHSGVGQRNLFASGSSSIGAGIVCRGSMWPIQGPEYYWGRRILGGEWHFVAMSYDFSAGSAIWYCDGLPMKTNALGRTGRVSFAKSFTLGSGGGRLGLEGAIDEVRFMPVALGGQDLRREFLKWQPIRYELHDWSVGEGETKKFRFRAHNESPEAVKKQLKFSNGAVVSLSLAPDETKDFTVDVRGGKPGLFTLFINEGEPDARQFECMCLAKEIRDNIPILTLEPGPAVAAKPERVRVRTWRDGDTAYALVCNTHPEPRTGTVRIDGGWKTATTVFGEGVSLKDGALALDMPNFAVAIVRLGK